MTFAWYGHLKFAEMKLFNKLGLVSICLLYTSDAADERSSVDLGGSRIIKKKTNGGYSCDSLHYKYAEVIVHLTSVRLK